MNLENSFKKIAFKNIKFCNSHNKFEILKIRNEENVRKYMFNSNIISEQDHNIWLSILDKSSIKNFYCIEYEKKIIGGLGFNLLDKVNQNFDWSFYKSQDIKMLSIGGLIELKALDYIFSKYNTNNLFCYVFKNNTKVLKLHKRFGFIETDFKNDFNIPKNISIKEVIFLHLNKDKWNTGKNMLYKKLFKL